jgi:hypothetical protein
MPISTTIETLKLMLVRGFGPSGSDPETLDRIEKDEHPHENERRVTDEPNVGTVQTGIFVSLVRGEVETVDRIANREVDVIEDCGGDGRDDCLDSP